MILILFAPILLSATRPVTLTSGLWTAQINLIELKRNDPQDLPNPLLTALAEGVADISLTRKWCVTSAQAEFPAFGLVFDDRLQCRIATARSSSSGSFATSMVCDGHPDVEIRLHTKGRALGSNLSREILLEYRIKQTREALDVRIATLASRIGDCPPRASQPCDFDCEPPSRIRAPFLGGIGG